MRKLIGLLLLVAALPAQDPGGRDGASGPAIHFVRWRTTPEANDIYRSAWRALEPHFVGQIGRRRLVNFDRSAEKARAYFAKNEDAALVVAFGAEAAAHAREALPKTPVLEVSTGEGSQVALTVPRDRLAAILRVFAPGVLGVAIVSDREEKLPGFGKTDPGVAWIAEGTDRIYEGSLPLVTTSAWLPEGRAILTVRPDPTDAGLKVAALVLRRLRDKEPFAPQAVARLRITVDLDVARREGYRVPLKMLARADAVRRSP